MSFQFLYLRVRILLEALHNELATSVEGWSVKECEYEFMSGDYVYLDNGGNLCTPGTCDAVRFRYKGTMDRFVGTTAEASWFILNYVMNDIKGSFGYNSVESVQMYPVPSE